MWTVALSQSGGLCVGGRSGSGDELGRTGVLEPCRQQGGVARCVRDERLSCERIVTRDTGRDGIRDVGWGVNGCKVV